MAFVNMWNVEAARVTEKLEKKIAEAKAVAENEISGSDKGVKQKAALLQLKKLLVNLEEVTVAYTKFTNKQLEEIVIDYKKIIDLKLEAEEIICLLEVLNEEAKPNIKNENVRNETLNVKLPKFEIKKFYGEVTKFTEFWETFEASIHNSNLSNVQKFTYLKGYLGGPAERLIQGIRITDGNYPIVVSKLKEKFGQDEAVINAHYIALHQLTKADNTTSSLRTTFDNIEVHLRSLEVLGEDTNHNSLMSVLYSKFPEAFLTKIQESGDSSTVKKLRESMENVITSREKARNWSQSFDKSGKNWSQSYEKNEKFKKRDEIPTDEKSSEKEERNPKCKFCMGSHYSDTCSTVKTIEQRKEKVKNLCNICFKANHETNKCESTKRCFYCKKKGNHHQSICPEKFGSAALSTQTSKNNDEEKSKSASTKTLLSESQKTSTLSYAETTLINGDAEKQVLAVFDMGSEKTYITEEAVKNLKLRPDYLQMLSIGQFSGTSVEKVTKVVTLKLKLSDVSIIEMKAHTIPKIAGNCRDRLLPAKFCKSEILNELNYADKGRLEEIDLLIGNDYSFDLITAEKIELQKHLYLIGSRLGWLLAGRTEDSKSIEEKSSCLLAPLDDHIQKMWLLDDAGIKQEYQHIKDDEAIEHFYNNVEYAENKYTVSWPWKKYPPELPTNYALALGQLQSIIKRLDKETLVKYNSIFEEQEKGNIIEEVDEKSDPDICHYLPHHPVFTPGKSTEMRLVFNGSAKTNVRNLSLNDCLIKGTVFLEKIAAIIIKFRMFKIALLADIEKAFLQIGLHKKDRDVVRFLWVNFQNVLHLIKSKKNLTAKELHDIVKNNLKIMRFTSVPFGVISSPFLLMITIIYHLRKYPELLHLIDNLYADNLTTGADNEEDAIKLYESLKSCFQQASMNLRKWKSNSPKVNGAIRNEDKEEKDVISVLGLIWSSNEDLLSVKQQKIRATEVTKRLALQISSSFFDPLGFFAPVIVTARIFIKNLWKEKYEWDEPLDEQLQEEWLEILKNLEKIHEIKIPRFIGKTREKCQLHCFCDASKNAYAAVIYIRMEFETYTSVKLLFAKARVSPVKEMSVPRLELMAATIGARATKFVQTAISKINADCYLWSDSKCVLYWLNSVKILPTFVSRRVEEINKLEARHRYVPSKQNPADIASRGCSVKDLQESIWWSAPAWLEKEEKSWPENLIIDEKEVKNVMDELEKNETKALLTNEEIEEEIAPQPPFDINIEEYADLRSLYKATAEKLENEDNNQNNEPEFERVERMWLLFDQKSHYSKQKLKSNFPKRLKVEQDENGLIRIDGRIKNADIHIETKYPILLVKKSHLTKLIILKKHEEVGHNGTSHTLAKLREKFWLPQGRREVYSTIVKACKNCKREFAKPFRAPEIAPLPEFRVRKDSRPFESIGVDVFGPFFIKKSIDPKVEKEKRWLVIFTCLTIRAIHLEVMSTMHSAEFLHAFRRFIARRGTPDLVISDNAPQFIVLKNTLHELWTEITKDGSIQEYFKESSIKWKLIPHYSPWMGGAYERLIKITKDSIRRTYGKITFSDRQLVTVAAEIEAIVNSRPLTYVEKEPDAAIITPNHFLQLKFPSVNVNQENVDSDTPVREKIAKLWKIANEYLNQVWKYWEKHYLLSLRERYETVKSAYRNTNRAPKIGEKVIILEPTTNRAQWKTATIEELTMSNDGIVRSVILRMDNGNITSRPIVKIAPLEADIEVIEENHPIHPDDESPTIEEEVINENSPEEEARISAEDEEFDEIVDIECASITGSSDDNNESS